MDGKAEDRISPSPTTSSPLLSHTLFSNPLLLSLLPAMDAFYNTISFTASSIPEEIVEIVDAEKGFTPALGYCVIA